MASLTMMRSVSGVRAFQGTKARVAPRISNGSDKYTMKRKDSYMVEVNVGEDEPEDIAVRKFMKKVVESRVIEQLRARRYKETPLEEYKRRTRERIERNKNKILEPTWEEEYSSEPYEVKPFEEFFTQDPNTEGGFVDNMIYQEDFAMAGQSGAYMPDAGSMSTWGGYVDGPNSNTARTGGYINQGGYMQ